MIDAADGRRPARAWRTLVVEVVGGAVTLTGELVYRSQVEHAIVAASRVAGVTAVRSSLTYNIDDMLVTGF